MTGKKTKEFLNLLRLASIFLLEEFFQVVHTGGHGGQEGIQDGKGGHGFYHYHGTRGNDGVMAAFDLDLDFFTLAGYGFWGAAMEGGLESGSEDDRSAVADSSGDTAGMIGLFLDIALLVYIVGIVVFQAGGGSRLSYRCQVQSLLRLRWKKWPWPGWHPACRRQALPGQRELR